MLTLLFFLLAFLLTVAIRPYFVQMIAASGFVKPNYRQEEIPLSAGIMFPFIIFLLYVGVAVAASLGLSVPFPDNRLLIGVLLMGFAGVLDDFLGSREASGLKGHFSRLLQRRELTTGALKALTGGVLAAYVLLPAGGMAITPAFVLLYLARILLVALATNFLNLLDLRPGRAAKGFILLSLLFLPFAWDKAEEKFLFACLGMVLAYLPGDLKARYMMGDAGSNVLGFVAGLLAVRLLPVAGEMALLVFLIFIHLFTEKYSLTEIIAKNRLLNFLDMLGRE